MTLPHCLKSVFSKIIALKSQLNLLYISWIAFYCVYACGLFYNFGSQPSSRLNLLVLDWPLRPSGSDSFQVFVLKLVSSRLDWQPNSLSASPFILNHGLGKANLRPVDQHWGMWTVHHYPLYSDERAWDTAAHLMIPSSDLTQVSVSDKSKYWVMCIIFCLNGRSFISLWITVLCLPTMKIQIPRTPLLPRCWYLEAQSPISSLIVD